jgi:hypothetical protein
MDRRVKCFSRTKLEKYEYIWSINNFSYYIGKQSIRCGSVLLGENFTMEMFLLPNRENYISIRASCKTSSIGGKVNFCIIDKDSLEVGSKEMSFTEEYMPSFTKFLNRNKLKKYLVDDCLTIKCQISIITSFQNEMAFI